MCHALPKPGEKTEKEWPKIMEQMAATAQLGAKEKKSILQYLIEHARHEAVEARMAAEKKLFETKCALCHTIDRVYVESSPRTTWNTSSSGCESGPPIGPPWRRPRRFWNI